MRATAPAHPAARFMSRAWRASNVSRPSPLREVTSSTASAPLNSWPAMVPARPSTAGSESGQACRQVIRRRGTPRARAASRQRSCCTPSSARACRRSTSAAAGSASEITITANDGRPGAGGEHGQQQRDDEGREREQEDGDRGDGVADEPRRRTAGHDTCRHADQQRQQQRRTRRPAASSWHAA